MNHARPCRRVSCRHHLYLDVVSRKSIKVNRPDLGPDELDQMADTCALDVADRGHHTLEEVGHLMNMTRERVRQVRELALRHARRFPRVQRLLAELDGDLFEHAEGLSLEDES